MRLEQLQAFLAIAQTGSFQQAARTYGVTQSLRETLRHHS